MSDTVALVMAGCIVFFGLLAYLAIKKKLRTKSDWEYIGGTENWDRVPKWLSKQIFKWDWHDLSHKWHDENKYIVIYGHTYEYQIIVAGQGGSMVYVSRRLRKKKQAH